MKIKDLIQELSQYDPELEVDLVVSYTEHCCSNDSGCYCSSEDHVFHIGSVCKEYGKLKKNKDVVKKVFIRGDI